MILLLLILISTLVLAVENVLSLRLGTASKGGAYFPLGKSISAVFDTAKIPIRIDVIETKGSVDNIIQLSKGKIDIAIVQNDVAFFAENGLSPFNKEIQNLTGILSFYLEPIYVLTNDFSIYYLSQIVNKKVNVGPIGSGLYTDAKIILNYHNLWPLVKKEYNSPRNGLNALLDGNISVAFTNVISESQKNSIINREMKFIPITYETISKLKKTYPYFTSFDIDEFGIKQKTIAMKSLLICRKDLGENLIYTLTKHIYENFGKLDFPRYNAPIIKDNIINSISLKRLHNGAKNYFQDIEILHSQSVFKYSSLFLFSITFIIIVVFLIKTFLFSKSLKSQQYSIKTNFLRHIKVFNNLIIKYKYLIVLFFMATAYFTMIIIVKEIEHNWAIQHNLTSSFDNQSFGQNLLWMFVFSGSGYEDKLFPNSPFGKFFVTLIPLIGIGGFITLAGLLTSDHIKNRLLTLRGVKSKMIKNHIILCGWNKNVPFLIDNLMHKNIIYKKPIVVLAKIDEELGLEANNIEYDLVTYVRGQATKRSDLDRANIQDADIAIIVANSKSSNPDAETILKILTIEKYGRELEKQGKRKNRDNIYTIAEIQDAENFQTAYDASVDEIISLGHIKSKILVQSVLNPGASKFINEILTYNEFNDIYSIKLDKYHCLIGYTFDEILVKLRQKQILLLSISIGNHRSRKAIKVIKEINKLNRTVLTNPISENEMNYKTQKDDILIVLAQYDKTIQKAIKSFKK